MGQGKNVPTLERKGELMPKKVNAIVLQSFSKQEWLYFMDNIDFSNEEIEIIKLIRQGFRQIDIAEDLSLCESTIKRKYKKILGKIDRFVLFNLK